MAASFQIPASSLFTNYRTIQRCNQSQDFSVGIATGYGLDDRGVGVRVPVRWRIFCSSRRSDWFWGPTSLLSNGYRGLFPGGKSARVVPDYSPPTTSISEVKITWSCTTTPPYTVKLGYSNIGFCDTLSIASDIINIVVLIIQRYSFIMTLFLGPFDDVITKFYCIFIA
jgi:hypothetical protein